MTRYTDGLAFNPDPVECPECHPTNGCDLTCVWPTGDVAPAPDPQAERLQQLAREIAHVTGCTVTEATHALQRALTTDTPPINRTETHP